VPTTSSIPFKPKSTAYLERGHFWAIPLQSGAFGAGCVVGRALRHGKPDSREFIAGVVAWTGIEVPTSEVLFGREVLAHAFAHIKAVTESGGLILGKARLQFRSLPTEAEVLSFSTWGYGVPRVLAQKYAAEHS